ncbi:MAG: ATP-binding protein [Verrucomicrobiota bacterium JB023]|nr:ATP-binding protein [Verrucomicrobiota bacterium JB023]
MSYFADQSGHSFIANLREDTLREIATAKSQLQDIWSLPLETRVKKGHSLGPLRTLRLSDKRLHLSHETALSRDNFSRIREGDLLRLTANLPETRGCRASFYEDDGETITVELLDALPETLPSTGLTLDPDFFDPTDRFLAALDALQTTEHGREVVLPLLEGGQDGATDLETYEDELDALEALPADEQFHSSQSEAIALCIAASRFHLVQGPPGTGKTHVLSEVAARLIARGHRVLLTGPTHRSIDHALRACRRRISAETPIAKISRVNFDPSSPVAHFERFSDAELPEDAPYLIGSTPHNLWSSASGLMSQFFDTVLLDESSQLTLMLATLALLRGERFLFFGDHCQLPPVRLSASLLDTESQSIFLKLRKADSTTMLTESWRLNRELAEWPSATFYDNRLEARFDRRLSLSPASPHPALQPSPSFVAIRHDEENATSRSAEEGELLAELILDLLRGGLSPSEIAVVTPFRSQAALIRRILRTRSEFSDWPVRELLADTVERLQGQEREVILISFAASQSDFILPLASFLLDEKRLNVAITRARRKTILIHSQTLLAVARSLADSEGDEARGANAFCSLLDNP